MIDSEFFRICQCWHVGNPQAPVMLQRSFAHAEDLAPAYLESHRREKVTDSMRLSLYTIAKWRLFVPRPTSDVLWSSSTLSVSCALSPTSRHSSYIYSFGTVISIYPSSPPISPEQKYITEKKFKSTFKNQNHLLAIMAPWTVRERMILHVLFGYHKLDFYGPTWWAIYRDITKTSRTERTCREDYKYSHGKERTQMYRRRILKPYSQYDADQRAAYDQAFQDVIDSARRQGIALPGNHEDESEEYGVDEDEDKENEGEDAEGDEAVDEENEDGKAENEGDAKMEDNGEDHVIAEEDISQMDDADDEIIVAPRDEVDDDVQMEGDVTQKVNIWGQHNLDVLEEEFPETPSTVNVLSSTIGARALSRKRAIVSATSSRDASAFPTHPGTVVKLNPTTATTLSSSNPVLSATLATDPPESPDTSSGEPQKNVHRRPGKQKSQTKSKTEVNDEDLRRGHRHLKRQLPGMEAVHDWLNEYDLDEEAEEETREPRNGVNGRTQDSKVNGHTPSADSIQPATTSKKPPRHQVKSAPAGQRVPLALITNKFQTVHPVIARSDQYDVWCRTNLDRLLFDEPYNMFPKPIKVPNKRAAPPEDPLPSPERVLNFFMDMFDRQLTRKLILSTLKKEPTSDMPGRRLEKVYNILLEKAEEMSTGPRYRLQKVFDSETSPFSNFRLASAVFGQGLKMLHMSDVDYTGVGNQQLVAFAGFKTRHLTADDIDFISPDDPVFKRGGRVHNLWVRQQECSILGKSKKYNSAHVCMDVMICQEAHCPKCSKDKDIGRWVKSVTSLPRVHARHVTPANEFVAPLLMVSRKHEKDYKDEFIVDVNIGVQSIKLWDGTTQDVVVCDAGNCPGCCEAFGGVVDTARETREKADTVTVRWQK